MSDKVEGERVQLRNEGTNPLTICGEPLRSGSSTSFDLEEVSSSPVICAMVREGRISVPEEHAEAFGVVPKGDPPPPKATAEESAAANALVAEAAQKAAEEKAAAEEAELNAEIEAEAKAKEDQLAENEATAKKAMKKASR